VTKIHPLVELSLEMLESVLDFSIKAEQGYQGFKHSIAKRFPDTFAAFNDTPNTKLVSPIKGELVSGTTETFTFESKDFTRFAIIIDGEFTFFEKNASGNFELTFTIPPEIDELQIFGTKNNRNFNGLLRYGVIKQ
jgi:hypothetical protein